VNTVCIVRISQSWQAGQKAGQEARQEAGQESQVRSEPLWLQLEDTIAAQFRIAVPVSTRVFDETCRAISRNKRVLSLASLFCEMDDQCRRNVFRKKGK
jgi:hypothetical protein